MPTNKTAHFLDMGQIMSLCHVGDKLFLALYKWQRYTTVAKFGSKPTVRLGALLNGDVHFNVFLVSSQ